MERREPKTLALENKVRSKEEIRKEGVKKAEDGGKNEEEQRVGDEISALRSMEPRAMGDVGPACLALSAHFLAVKSGACVGR